MDDICFIIKRIEASGALLKDLATMDVNLEYLAGRIYEYFQDEERWQSALYEKKKALDNSRQLHSRCENHPADDKRLKHITSVVSHAIFMSDDVKRLHGVMFDDVPTKEKPHYLRLLRALYNLFGKSTPGDGIDSPVPARSKKPLKYMAAILLLFDIHLEAGFCDGCRNHDASGCTLKKINLCKKFDVERHIVWNFLRRNNLF